jgi:type VI secretion system protein ImpG
VNEELLSYYERELTFIRQMAGEFKEKYPKIAGRLQLDGEKECEDPHVERLIEAFALLAGRVHHKLDDEFPEITEALLDALYPHYIRPVPSMGIVQFQLDSTENAPASTHVPSGTTIQTRPDEGHVGIRHKSLCLTWHAGGCRRGSPHSNRMLRRTTI